MSKIGVFIEIVDQALGKSVPGVVGAACRGGDVVGFVLDDLADKDRELLEEYGVTEVVVVGGREVALSELPVSAGLALADAVKASGVKALLGVSSSTGNDLLTRAALSLQAPLVLDCTGIDFNTNCVRKSHFSGKATATLQLTAAPFVCGIRPNSFDPVPEKVACTITKFEYAGPIDDAITVTGVEKSGSGRKDLAEADIIITGGRPIGSSENFKILEECADTIDAAIGASRAAVDAGYAPHSMQVGLTGKIVSPKLYIGCGLSGSVQHFAGMKSSKLIVGINTDKDAPIFSKSDYGIIGDLFEVVPLLTRQLQKRR
ncbi:electron transfer flavoprotein subunit alpha/FixB family protein [Desulforhopalus singaporensis]|uniref:Electron transfer flavoprotein subunit alpha n=1 Tax=Desulforhopalus singaporensis TaxID=91360 RepID=A0A1H0RYF6_9BACT|nr:electron transfer flavoprotein subunit alpha/FixB family protein [Desulforhopalus singaporensis]SDP34417.1 electron transfer flavoprotein alpha subunit [Desulforhopalus singaporensis]